MGWFSEQDPKIKFTDQSSTEGLDHKGGNVEILLWPVELSCPSSGEARLAMCSTCWRSLGKPVGGRWDFSYSSVKGERAFVHLCYLRVSERHRW